MSPVVADCPEATTVADVARATELVLDALEVAIEPEEVAAAQHQLDQAHRVALCLGQRVTPLEAARLHFADAVLAFVGGGDPAEVVSADPVAARPHLQAMLLADATFLPRASLVPPGTPIAVELEALQSATPASQALPAERGLRWAIDGARVLQRPVGLPVLLQVEGCGTGEVLRTRWLAVGDPLPTVDDLTVEAPRAQRVLTGLTVGLLAGAAGSWAAAIGTRVAWSQGDQTAAAWDANHATFGLAIGLSGAGLGTGVAALTTHMRCAEP